MTSAPLAVRTADTRTCEFGGEYRSALSINSASTCTRSAATEPLIVQSGAASVITRVYSSTSEAAASTTVATGTGAS